MVLLTKQFRFPAYVNGHPDGMLIEAAADLLEEHDPATAIRREASEELGVVVGHLIHVFDAYMSPGSVTERVHFYAAEYTPSDRTGLGGGVTDESEDIEVHALSAVCTHAGGPLDEGTLVDGCVKCPWHGSEFRLDDGEVKRGPASVAQPVWDVKVEVGRVSVRPRAA